jgi:hypothetical protein
MDIDDLQAIYWFIRYLGLFDILVQVESLFPLLNLPVDVFP